MRLRERYLERDLQELAFRDHKIALVSGPRRSGKTTLARALIRARGAGKYWNWDDVEFRRAWVRQPRETVAPPRAGKPPLVVYDEIHKDRRWKRTLKGIYDTLDHPCDILVTGSARLDVYRKGSDSLLGRYVPFRLHPFSLREMSDPSPLRPEDALGGLFERSLRGSRHHEAALEDLMEFGPFPEPLFTRDARRARIWRQTRVEALIREDLRDLSRLPDLGRVELLASLLPSRVGAPVSIQSIRQDLEVSHDAVKRWLGHLIALYYVYEVKPWTRSIPRSIRKEGKLYFWDFAEVLDRPARFENLVASHLLKACDYWTQTGEGRFELYTLRNKEKQELDFLITRDRQAWLPVEVKLSDATPTPHWRKFLGLLRCKRGLQVVAGRHWRLHREDDRQVLVAGAAEALRYFA